MPDHIRIYTIKHPAFRGEIYVVANDIDEALTKFKNNYEHDYDVIFRDVESISLKEDIEAIV